MNTKNTTNEDTIRESCDGTEGYYHMKGDGSWWENDARGIALCRVCDRCRKAKLATYRPEILTGYDQSDVDEPIEPEAY